MAPESTTSPWTHFHYTRPQLKNVARLEHVREQIVDGVVTTSHDLWSSTTSSTVASRFLARARHR